MALCSLIGPSTVLHFLFHAQASNAAELQHQCLIFVDNNAEALLASDTILTLPQEHFRYLVSRDSFIVDEIEIFKAVHRWKEYNSRSLDEITELLKCVRLSEIPRQELDSVVGPSGLYDPASINKAIKSQPAVDISSSISTRGNVGKSFG